MRICSISLLLALFYAFLGFKFSIIDSYLNDKHDFCKRLHANLLQRRQRIRDREPHHPQGPTLQPELLREDSRDHHPIPALQALQLEEEHPKAAQLRDRALHRPGSAQGGD